MLSHLWLFVTPWTKARQASLSLTISWSLPKFMSIGSMMSSSHLILHLPLLLPSIFHSIRVFSNNFTSGGQNIGASASTSVLPENIEGWFLLRLTSLIPCFQGTLNSVLQVPQFKSINSLVLSYCPAFTSVHDYWKDHRFDYMDLCQQSDIFAF